MLYSHRDVCRSLDEISSLELKTHQQTVVMLIELYWDLKAAEFIRMIDDEDSGVLGRLLSGSRLCTNGDCHHNISGGRGHSQKRDKCF
ncbi:hypothetical protein [Pseudoalteromonas xiamenensis]|uniref:Uncharacterized protein n=1 Tax=Pseudoalteromonas xiamenensis TaxID=882626 RepID=A0A975HK23_9GAMM|nr:hypothetical protein [Pseudoalteromonas xiamenensis]QTH70586.1 hypothetical protein J5O05_11570 [Pseudoalteromonas xiamenensis]